MAEDQDKEKEELISLIESAEPEAKKLESLGQTIVESARFFRDISGPLAQVYKQIPAHQMPSGEWSRQSQSWRAWYGAVSGVQGMQTNVNNFTAMTASSANTAVSGVTMIFGGSPPLIPPPPAAKAAITTLFQTLERHPQAEKAIASMRRLGLDRRGGDFRPALDLLNEAKGAIERPVVGSGGPVSVLISLRECIGAAIAELVRRRPKQEEVKRWSAKVVSVGGQCGRPSLPSDHFTRLGDDADRLMDRLSGAKQTGMDRTQLMGFFNQGLLFLNALMDSIDESKLRLS